MRAGKRAEGVVFSILAACCCRRRRCRSAAFPLLRTHSDHCYVIIPTMFAPTSSTSLLCSPKA